MCGLGDWFCVFGIFSSLEEDNSVIMCLMDLLSFGLCFSVLYYCNILFVAKFSSVLLFYVLKSVVGFVSDCWVFICVDILTRWFRCFFGDGVNDILSKKRCGCLLWWVVGPQGFEPWTNRFLSGSYELRRFLVEFCRSTMFLGKLFFPLSYGPMFLFLLFLFLLVWCGCVVVVSCN